MDTREAATTLAGFLGLPASQGSKLFLGQATARPTDSTGHGGLLSEMQDLAYTCHLTKEASLHKGSTKGKSRT
jgi:hypothetical protein